MQENSLSGSKWLRPAALLVSTNTATQQGSHSGLSLTSTQEASSVSTDTPIAPASPARSREGAGSQLNPGVGPSCCLKRNMQLVQQYTGCLAHAVRPSTLLSLCSAFRQGEVKTQSHITRGLEGTRGNNWDGVVSLPSMAA